MAMCFAPWLSVSACRTRPAIIAVAFWWAVFVLAVEYVILKTDAYETSLLSLWKWGDVAWGSAISLPLTAIVAYGMWLQVPWRKDRQDGLFRGSATSRLRKEDGAGSGAVRGNLLSGPRLQ
jgi:hypothetical protein